MSTPPASSADAGLAVVEQALRALVPAPTLLTASPDGHALAAQVRAATADGAVIGALGVLDDLDHLAPLVDALRDAAAAGATVAVTMPNTPYTGRGRAWGAGGADELRSLLGPGEVALAVTGLAGAALVVPGSAHAASGLSAEVPSDAVALLAVVALGPRAVELAPTALVRARDLAAERAELRALRADVAYLEARVAELEARAAAAGARAVDAGPPTPQLPA